MDPHELVTKTGGRFSAELGIDPAGEAFKWLLASVLFGARISWKIAERTYRCFERHRALSPEDLMKTGWDGLVAILDEGGYVRYDFSTASKLIEMSENLQSEYGGSLDKLHSESADPADLEKRIMALAKGIGPVTAGIFLREMRGSWEKAQPLPSDKVVQTAKELGYIPENIEDRKDALDILVNTWGDEKDFPDFEAALQRKGMPRPRAGPDCITLRLCRFQRKGRTSP